MPESPKWNELAATDQATLLRAPMWILLTVASADGSIEKAEIEAFLELLNAQNGMGSDLLAELMQELAPQAKARFDETVQARAQTTPAETMAEVADVVDRILPDEGARAFKVALLRIGLRVAEATGDHPGAKVEAREKQRLEQLARALGVQLH